jgi:outer membrane protein assembly factor BamD
MEKPDRDYTHAKRAEDEYKQLIQQFPDSKLVPEAKQRLMEVQEVLAEREFRIGRFYFIRESYAASIARLRSVTDNYALYSGADEALYLLGQSYEKLIEQVRANGRLSETIKGKLVGDYIKHAAEAYDKIITRYPAMDRVNDAKERLVAMKQPVPTPTPEAVKLSQAEEASRSELSKKDALMGLLKKGPDTSHATKVGEPQLEEPKETSATQLAKENQSVLARGPADTKVGLEAGTAGTGAAPKSEAPPTSTPAGTETPSTEQPAGQPQLNDATPPAAAPASAASTPIPTQTNEAATEQNSQEQAQAAGQTATDTNKKDESTSKKKKKKGIRKLIPF